MSRGGEPSVWQRGRGLRCADIAREQGLDLTLQWVEVVERLNAEAKVAGDYPVRLPARPLLALALEVQAGLCRHGLRPEDCRGEQHHDWSNHPVDPTP